MVPLSPWGTILKGHRGTARSTISSRCHVIFSPKEPFRQLPHFRHSKQPHPFLNIVAFPVEESQCVYLNPVYSRPVSVLITRLLLKILRANGAPQHPSSVAAHLFSYSQPHIFLLIFQFLVWGGKTCRVGRSHFPSGFAIASLFVAFVDFERWGNPTITHSVTVF